MAQNLLYIFNQMNCGFTQICPFISLPKKKEQKSPRVIGRSLSHKKEQSKFNKKPLPSLSGALLSHRSPKMKRNEIKKKWEKGHDQSI